MFVVVKFDALAQASDFQIERRQVVFLCECRIWTRVFGTESPADWMRTDKPTDLSRIKLKTWTQCMTRDSMYCLCIHVIIDNKYMHTTPYITWYSMSLYAIIDKKYMHTTPYMTWCIMSLYTLLCYYWQKIHAHHTIYDLMHYVFVYITMLLLTKNTCTPHHIWPDALCLCIHYYFIIDKKYMHTTPYMTWCIRSLYTLLCYYRQKIHAHHTIYDLMYYVFVYITMLLLTKNTCTPHHIWPDVLGLCIHYYAIIDKKYMHTTIYDLMYYVFVYIIMLSLKINTCTPRHVWLETVWLCIHHCYYWQWIYAHHTMFNVTVYLESSCYTLTIYHKPWWLSSSDTYMRQ